uniref:aldehyde dehydrogenase family protein n=1 Tax=Nevskia ramosa TaxID=64002 RepID=UPI0023564EA9
MSSEYQNYIDGRFVAHRGATIEVHNPATFELIARVPDAGADVVDEAVAAARRAQPAWEKLPPIQRAAYLRKISAKLRENVEMLATIIAREQGKVMPLARVEVNFT